MKKYTFSVFAFAALFAVIFSSIAYAALPMDINQREYDKFVELATGKVAVRVSTSSVAPSSVTYTDGRKVVTTAGTAVALAATATTFDECSIQAEEDNTGDIVIGGSTVVEDPATRQGVLILPANAYHFAHSGDLANIYIDSEINGDGVTFLCQ